MKSILTFSLVLEELLGSKLQDVVQLLFGHGARLGSEAGSDYQVSQHHLLLSDLEGGGKTEGSDNCFTRSSGTEFHSFSLQILNVRIL